MKEKDFELIVSKQELGTLETNALAIKEKIQELLPTYDVSNYSENNLDKAKEDKALLNKTSKALNDKRIELEKEFMMPFENFKAIVKETTDLIKEASSKIDEIVKSVENKEKEEKRKNITTIFESLVGELKDLLILEKIFDEKWLNKTFKIEEIKRVISEKIEQVRNDLISIGKLKSKYEIELKNEYLNNFDLGAIIRKNEELNEKEEKLKLQQEESVEVIEKVKEEKMRVMSQVKVEECIFDEILTYTLRITGKKSQLQALKEFMNINEMKYEKVEE